MWLARSCSVRWLFFRSSQALALFESLAVYFASALMTSCTLLAMNLKDTGCQSCWRRSNIDHHPVIQVVSS
jgi:hypothetical protein